MEGNVTVKDSDSITLVRRRIAELRRHEQRLRESADEISGQLREVSGARRELEALLKRLEGGAAPAEDGLGDRLRSIKLHKDRILEVARVCSPQWLQARDFAAALAENGCAVDRKSLSGLLSKLSRKKLLEHDKPRRRYRYRPPESAEPAASADRPEGKPGP
jgi:hypothetical protein